MKICQKNSKTSYHLTGNLYNFLIHSQLSGGKMSKIDLTGSYLILPDPT